MITGTVEIAVGETVHPVKVDMKTLARLEELGLSFIKTCRLVSQVQESKDYESFPFARVSMTIGAILRNSAVVVSDDDIMAAMMADHGVVNAVKAVNDIAVIAFPERPGAKKAEA